MNELKEVQWTKDDMIEVNLKEPDDFLKVRETLTRIGVLTQRESYINHVISFIKKDNTTHKFQRTFALDGKKANLRRNDVQRRNRVSNCYPIGV